MAEERTETASSNDDDAILHKMGYEKVTRISILLIIT